MSSRSNAFTGRPTAWRVNFPANKARCPVCRGRLHKRGQTPAKIIDCDRLLADLRRRRADDALAWGLLSWPPLLFGWLFPWIGVVPLLLAAVAAVTGLVAGRRAVASLRRDSCRCAWVGLALSLAALAGVAAGITVTVLALMREGAQQDELAARIAGMH